MFQFLRREVLDDIIDSLSLVGKQHIQAECAVAVGQGQHFTQVVPAVGSLDREVHHLVLDYGTVLFCEGPVARILRVKFFGPGGLEVDSIEQIHGDMRVKLVKYHGNHAVGVGIAPVVDDVHIAIIAEVKRIDFSVVALLHFGLVLRNELEAHCRVDVDVVSDS